MTCEEVIAPGILGEIGLLPGHVHLLTALKPGVLTVVHDRKRTHRAVSTGFVEIEDDTVTILTDACEEAAAIDVARAKRALSEAEAALQDLSPWEPKATEERRRAERARARLETVARVK